MDRREFLARAGMVATWAAIPITISCSDEDDTTAGPLDGDVAGTVTGSDHTHAGAVVTAAELQAGNAVSLTLTGNGHTHTLNLTADEVMTIAGGTQVSKSTVPDTTGHSHLVIFN